MKQEEHVSNGERWSLSVEYTRLGEMDKAFEWLDKMYEERNGMFIWLKTVQEFYDLRQDPRYADLLRRVGFPP